MTSVTEARKSLTLFTDKNLTQSREAAKSKIKKLCVFASLREILKKSTIFIPTVSDTTYFVSKIFDLFRFHSHFIISEKKIYGQKLQTGIF